MQGVEQRELALYSGRIVERQLTRDGNHEIDLQRQ